MPIKFENNFLTVESTFPNKMLRAWAFSRHDNEIYICVEDLQLIYISISKTPNSENSTCTIGTTNPRVSQASQFLFFFVFFFICVCISIACLLVTVLTYLVIPKLQTQPGINNVILCVSVACPDILLVWCWSNVPVDLSLVQSVTFFGSVLCSQ